MMDDVLALMRHPLGPEWGRNKPVYKGLYCDVAVLIPAGGSELAQSCIWILRSSGQPFPYSTYKQGLDVERRIIET